MKYKKIKMNNYNLHLISADNFNKTIISVNFKSNIIKEEITIRQFLFDVLCSTTSKYNTERLLEMKLEDLYDSYIFNYPRKIGNKINNAFNMIFLNSKYTDNNQLNESLNLLIEMLFNPNINNNKFNTKAFNNAKKSTIEYLNSIKNKPAYYSKIKAYEELGTNDINSYSLSGYIDDLKKISEKSLYNYYKKLFINNEINIFMVGAFDEDVVINKFKKEFIINNKYIDNDDYNLTYNKNNKLIEKVEKLNSIKQAKLSLILKVININDYEREILLPLYSLILGGNTYSKLFQNVREKNSLAYSINAYPDVEGSNIFIACGIDNKNYNKTLKLIRKEIDDMSKNITITELDNAKKEILSSFKSIYDEPSSIIEYYYETKVLNKMNISDTTKELKKITVTDIYNFSKKIEISIIYLLKGNNNE